MFQLIIENFSMKQYLFELLNHKWHHVVISIVISYNMKNNIILYSYIIYKNPFNNV